MHIVIFTGGAVPPPEKTALYFSSVPPADYVIAADSGLDSLELFRAHFGGSCFFPSLIIGDMDSLHNRSLLEKYRTVPYERFACDKDFTDTELALMKAQSLAKGQEDRVTLVGGSGGITDHFIAVYDSFSSQFHADVWLCEQQLAFFLGEGMTAGIFQLRPEDRISAARLTREFSCSQMEARGLEWSCFRKEGMASISNRISERFFAEGLPVTLRPVKGSFLVFLPYAARFQIPFETMETVRTNKKSADEMKMPKT